MKATIVRISIKISAFVVVIVENDISEINEVQKIKPCRELESYIHFYWELKGHNIERQWERVFPDGCAGIVMNFGDNCLTDNGSTVMEFCKTYVVGAMTSFIQGKSTS